MRFGKVAIMGRPNVGKSSLFNRLLGQHIASVTHKPHTTRCAIQGILCLGDCQAIVMDSPGVQTKYNRFEASRILANQSQSLITEDLDILLLMGSCVDWKKDEDFLVEISKNLQDCVYILVLNKIDLMPDKQAMLPLLAELNQCSLMQEVVPISVAKGLGIDRLTSVLKRSLPKVETLPFSPEDPQIFSDMLACKELIWEKTMRRLHQEIPYQTRVAVRALQLKKNHLNVEADILVNKKSHIAIAIGKRGETIKQIGMQAKKALHKLYNRRTSVFLRVKLAPRTQYLTHEMLTK